MAWVRPPDNFSTRATSYLYYGMFINLVFLISLGASLQAPSKVVALAIILPPTLAWAGIPIAFHYDVKYVQSTFGWENVSRWHYIAVIPGYGLPSLWYYLYKRRAVTSFLQQHSTEE